MKKVYAVKWDDTFTTSYNEPLPIFETQKEAKRYEVSRNAVIYGIDILYKGFKSPFRIIPMILAR